jgi:mitochondrial import inner membrane translocase subunit TIM50
LTYLEQKRREAQMQYQEEQKYLRDNKEALEKLLEQEQQAMAAQVPGNLWEAFGQLLGAPPPPGSGPPGEVGPGTTPSAPSSVVKS